MTANVSSVDKTLKSAFSDLFDKNSSRQCSEQSSENVALCEQPSFSGQPVVKRTRCENRGSRGRKRAKPANAHWTGGNSVQCEVCRRICASVRSLQVHMRQHTNEKPFSCMLCGVAFRQVGSLKYHERHHHAAQSTHKRKKRGSVATSTVGLRQIDDDQRSQHSDSARVTGHAKKQQPVQSLATKAIETDRQCKGENDNNVIFFTTSVFGCLFSHLSSVPRIKITFFVFRVHNYNVKPDVALCCVDLLIMRLS